MNSNLSKVESYTKTINTLRSSFNLDYNLDRKILDILPKLIEARARCFKMSGLTTKYESAIMEEERTRHWIKGDHGYFAGSYSDGKSSGAGGLTNSGGGGIMSVGSGDELEQAKTRDKKIIITDIAIEKVNAPDIPFLSEEQNQRFKELNKELLRKAKYENDSNEVAILFDPRSLTYQMEFGDVSSVNVFNNPLARDMIRKADEKSLFLLHNHPSTKNFSYTDIGVLLTNDSYAGMTAVANTGVISTVYKTARYDRNLALKVIKDIRINYPQILSGSDDVEIVQHFLKVSANCGVETI